MNDLTRLYEFEWKYQSNITRKDDKDPADQREALFAEITVHYSTERHAPSETTVSGAHAQQQPSLKPNASQLQKKDRTKLDTL
ncbi:hypothetical protein GWI33_010708 [Rhynchophorus ferrugineus]|uniref:Uncharacterized protein n=1 Tax=Rhynchophorus ferrugineus TaxID=354439 RepID=A0A834IDX0_RHYFE|nr:hypothetical protein GWI33_010708 [Rhynchophorus ferrugineus]